MTNVEKEDSGQKLEDIIRRYSRGTDHETARSDAEIYVRIQYAYAQEMYLNGSELDFHEDDRLRAEKWKRAVRNVEHGRWENVSLGILKEGVQKIEFGGLRNSSRTEDEGYALVNLACSIRRLR